MSRGEPIRKRRNRPVEATRDQEFSQRHETKGIEGTRHIGSKSKRDETTSEKASQAREEARTPSRRSHGKIARSHVPERSSGAVTSRHTTGTPPPSRTTSTIYGKSRNMHASQDPRHRSICKTRESMSKKEARE
jgi:hypothetical protein